MKDPTGRPRVSRSLKGEANGVRASRRTITLPARMVKACRAHVGEHGTSRDGFLFSMVSGFPINPDDFDRLWGQAVRRSGSW